MMIRKIITKNNRGLQYFPESELTELHNEGFVRSYKKGQILFYSDDPRNRLILLVSGVIKIEKNDHSGNFSYLHFMKRQALFPRIELFQDEVHYDSAIAYMDIEVVFVSVKLFECLLQNNPQRLVHWVQEQSVLLKESMIETQGGTTNDACERIVAPLAMLLNNLGERIDNRKRVAVTCPITTSDIARISGTTRETASSAMRKLVRTSRISYSHKFLTFLGTPFFTNRLSN